MISPKMLKNLSHQINNEWYSSYLYLAMANKSAALGLNGFANWFTVQVQEEMVHGKKIYDYVISQGEMVQLEEIKKPPQSFKDAKKMFQATLDHEKTVTSSINALVTQARKENDHATDIFLQWFVTEQVEEESSALEILQKINLAGDGNGLFMLDNELAARVFTPPAEAA